MSDAAAALDAVSDAKQHRSIMDYRCGIDDCGDLVARLHPTDEGRLLLVAYGQVRRYLDPSHSDDPSPFVIDGWGDLTEQQRRDEEWQRAAEIVIQRDVRDPQWAVRSYAGLVQRESQTAAGQNRGEIHEAAWLDGAGAVSVSCRRHRLRTLRTAGARRLAAAARHLHRSTALVV